MVYYKHPICTGKVRQKRNILSWKLFPVVKLFLYSRYMISFTLEKKLKVKFWYFLHRKTICIFTENVNHICLFWDHPFST